MNLQFVNYSQTPVPIKYISLWMEHVEEQLVRKRIVKTFNGKNLSLVFLETRAARQLNKTYRNKDRATDVLSFGSRFKENLGELVFCPQVIKRQAKQNRHSYRDELAYLALHGLLHLLGFRHEGMSMYELQDSIFLGIENMKR